MSGKKCYLVPSSSLIICSNFIPASNPYIQQLLIWFGLSGFFLLAWCDIHTCTENRKKKLNIKSGLQYSDYIASVKFFSFFGGSRSFSGDMKSVDVCACDTRVSKIRKWILRMEEKIGNVKQLSLSNSQIPPAPFVCVVYIFVVVNIQFSGWWKVANLFYIQFFLSHHFMIFK